MPSYPLRAQDSHTQQSTPDCAHPPLAKYRLGPGSNTPGDPSPGSRPRPERVRCQRADGESAGQGPACSFPPRESPRKDLLSLAGPTASEKSHSPRPVAELKPTAKAPVGRTPGPVWELQQPRAAGTRPALGTVQQKPAAAWQERSWRPGPWASDTLCSQSLEGGTGGLGRGSSGGGMSGVEPGCRNKRPEAWAPGGDRQPRQRRW